MGQTLTTPLSLTLDHWPDVRARADNLSVDVRKKKWVIFCSSEWPTVESEWPRDGTFNLNIISQVKAKVFSPGPHGHPDQRAYIVNWESLARDPPLWVQPFVISNNISNKPQPPLTPIAPKAPPPQESQPLVPLPPAPSPALPSSSLYPTILKEKVPKEKPLKPTPAPPPVLPPNPNSPLTDLLSEEPPPYADPEEPESPDGSETAAAGGQPAQVSPAPSPMAGRLPGRRKPPPDSTTHALPLREGPNGRQQYWPFFASDLYYWKHHNPPFSKDPITLTNLIESILVTHHPTWDDCQQHLQTLLISEEKQRVFLEARKNVPGDNGSPTLLPNEIDEAFPLTRPDWDFTTATGRGHLCLYRQLLIVGLRGAARRPTNLAQVKQVIQGNEETPSAFLERLKDAYRMYTPYDPEDPGQATSVSMSSIWQSSPDIRSKLQRLEGL
ncbi:histone acetyltransferase p300-like [Microtus oregoni]|uniref:histone acetyltransferase p300-like n=1 Tax=Microtus oregoni TaxID=111838 RepID=UPI001BB1E30A|nr:histone acetyltransferase p300-like [Microtus oregoni]